MARVFNLVVFDGTITGDAGANPPPVFYTSQEHAALLGSVERLKIQMISRATTSLAGTITFVYQVTNAPEYDSWVNSVSKTLSLPAAAGDLPAIAMHYIDSMNEQAAYGRFKISYDQAATAQFQLIVAGYAD